MFRLTRVQVLDKPHDAVVSLGDLIGSADLETMYHFNYMHDIPWVMSQTISSPESHFVYGYFGRDEQGDALKRQSRGFKGVHIHGISLPAPYSTHHSKIMVLFFRDGTLKIVVHTANMIEFDWANMTQGIWQTPRLYRRGEGTNTQKLRADLRRYFASYSGLPAIAKLAAKIREYDFGALGEFQLVASVPGNYTCRSFGLKRINVPATDKVVIQCSSIAALAKDYLEVLKAEFNTKDLEIVYPTVNEVANSLNGYGSGASIHLKRQTKPQQEQYERLKPCLRKWRSLKASRQLAAPHIKTYTGIVGTKVSWILLTSANLSKQAWGTTNKKRQTQWIQSWEAGILQVFEKPQDPTYLGDGAGWCLPYDLPTTKYDEGDVAWSPNEAYTEDDIHGRTWPF